MIARSIVVAIALAGAGCERADQTPTTKRVTIATAVTKVTLRDAGSEPRQQLRYRIAAQQATVFEHETRMIDRWDGGATETYPTVTMREQRRVAEVQADGAMRDVGRILDITYDRPVDEVWKRFTWLRGATFDGWMDARGAPIGDLHAVIDERLTPRDYDPDSTPYTLVFPEEPVGVGARWEIEASRPGARATIRVELVRITGTTIDVETKFDHQSDAMAMMSATGEGRVRLDLRGVDSGGTYLERATGVVDNVKVTREITTTMRRAR